MQNQSLRVVAQKKRPGLHPLERTLLALVTIHLVFLPWAFGTMHIWSQLTSLGLAAIGFAVALSPRNYTEANSDRGTFRLQLWPRLVRFPLFWLGLVFLGYLLLQAANPAWTWETNGKQWWLRKLDSVAWLPSSTKTPFTFFNLWREFVYYGAAWLTVCAIWVGFTRRRSLSLLLYLLVGNAVALTIAGIVRMAQRDPKILWVRSVRGAYGFASFVYHNHGAAYLALFVLFALGIAAWHFVESRKRLARSSPTLVWAILAGFILLGVAYSTSRGAVAIALAACGLATVMFFFLRRGMKTASTTPAMVPLLVGAMLAGCLGFVLMKSDLSQLKLKFEKLSEQGVKEESYEARVLTRGHAVRMFEANWLYGTGAGSFRFLFPEYIKNDPQIYMGGKAFWEHAHIDWLEIPIEVGICGSALIAGAFGWAVVRWARWRGWRHPVGVMLFIGLMQTLLHALVEFPFQCPAILITWWAVLALMLRWLEIDDLAATPGAGLVSGRSGK